MIELIFKPNKVTDNILPWGTPISCSCKSERHEPRRTQKFLFLKKPMKHGNLPRSPALRKSFIMPYFHVLSYAFSISKNIAINELSLHKSFLNEWLQSNEMISCAALFAKATLNRSNKIISFQKPYYPVVDHPFHNFAYVVSDQVDVQQVRATSCSLSISPSVTEINGHFRRKSPIFPTPMY